MFAIQAEVTGKSYSGADFDQKSTADFIVGPVFWIKPGFYIRPAWSYALSYDGAVGNSSAKKSGKQISIGYHPGTPCCEVYVPPPPPPPPANRPPTVSLDCVQGHDPRRRDDAVPGHRRRSGRRSLDLHLVDERRQGHAAAVLMRPSTAPRCPATRP